MSASAKKSRKKTPTSRPLTLTICSDCRIRLVVFEKDPIACAVCGSKNISKESWSNGHDKGVSSCQSGGRVRN